MNNEADLLKALKESGVAAQAIIACFILYTGLRLRALEKRVDAVGIVIGNCPTCRKHAPVVPLVSALLLGLLCCGCVQTRFEHGGTVMTRTAFLTRVSVPSITISTNGTLKASIESDARTELLEALLKTLATMPK